MIRSCKILLLTEAEEETFMVGASLGKWIRPGEVVALLGDLGSGKTCLTQGIARGLDVPESCCVRSPSFVILNTYPGRCTVHHLDLYRVRDALEMEDLGWREILYGGGVCVIEWADRMLDLLPERHVRVLLFHRGETNRRIEIEVWGDPDGERSEDLRRSLARFEREDAERASPEEGFVDGGLVDRAER
jgi:tRNA threonylcarbamoyladenosine biosynthesis protein TsaE